jgi:lipopolysaccharide biosynthesis glycosyltransferase
MLLTGFSGSMQESLRRTLDSVGRPYELTFLPEEAARSAFRGCASLHGSHATYYRLVLPDLVDEPRLLYVDADTLPLIDVAPLFKVDMGEHVAGFIVDGRVRTNLDGPFLESIGRSLDGETFNAGVMLVRPPLWKQQERGKQVLEFLQQYGPRLISHDQTLLNALFADDCYHIDPRFNIKVYARRSSLVGHTPGLYHFLGAPKPWDFLGRTLLPCSGKWFDELKRIPLPATKKLLWLNGAYWKRAPRMLGGYKRLLLSRS